MRRPGHPVVHVTVRSSNRDKWQLYDLARRQADHLGPFGISAKRGETDEQIEERGYMRLPFPNQQTADGSTHRVDPLGEDAIRCRLMISRRRYRH